jgi:prepilin-type N-terminal cleavage/methylation domain-containing protein
MLRMMNCSHLPTSCVDHRGRRERGFTLLEIMVVVMLIGLLLAIGIPMMRRSLVRAEMLAEVGMVKQAVTVARIAALKQGQRVAMKILDDNAAQEGGLVMAWYDGNNDGLPDELPDGLVGRWIVKDKYTLRPDASNVLLKLGGTARGVVFLPNGNTIAAASGALVGQGALVVEDVHSNNVRLSVRGGTGTVIQQMWDYDNSEWSNQIRFWRY